MAEPHAGFRGWVADNADRIAEAKKRGTLPNFLRDNDIQKLAWEGQRVSETARGKAIYKTAEQKQAVQRAWDKRRSERIIDTPEKLNSAITLAAADLIENSQTGEIQIAITKNAAHNGSTTNDGRIKLSPQRYKDCQTAITKIRQGREHEILREEADAMATLWHEITHNRHKGLESAGSTTSASRSCMELANELTARKTLPEFYRRLGAKSVPFEEFMTNRESTGYNRMVNCYDRAISIFRGEADAYDIVQKHLFNAHYSKQKDGLIKGLMPAIERLRNDGWVKYNGLPMTRADVGRIVAQCVKHNKYSDGEDAFYNWLKINYNLTKKQ